MERAFAPIGATQVINATTTKSAPVQLYTDVMDGSQYRIFNSGSVPVFISCAGTAEEASSRLVIPSPSSSQFSWPIAAGAVEVFSGQDDAWICVVTAAGAGVIYVTPGRGL